MDKTSLLISQAWWHLLKELEVLLLPSLTLRAQLRPPQIKARLILAQLPSLELVQLPKALTPWVAALPLDLLQSRMYTQLPSIESRRSSS